MRALLAIAIANLFSPSNAVWSRNRRGCGPVAITYSSPPCLAVARFLRHQQPMPASL
ncbi:hypothetical protein COLO4_32631 [Corchorus olitorius]|uniref:Uncharacterized protein n=1 Tax=Corchorus olitorius TaxID=93759 RepID=A0A1R3GZ16_9ROSI|nr:hypothetical protein COLO4_32631 [Corchorus olitorius]